MSKCPFWSSRKEKVNCNGECPMSPSQNNNETCPFIEHLSAEKIVFKDVLDEDFEYSRETKVEYILPSYIEYKD